MSRGFASNYRIVLLATGLLACFATIGVRLVYLHVIDRDALLQTIERTRHDDFLEIAQRGDILDANGAKLATSRPMIMVAVDPSLVQPDDEAKFPQLARLLDMPLAEVRRICLTKYRLVSVPRPQPAAAANAAASTPAAAAGPLLTLNLLGIDGDARSAAAAAQTASDAEFQKAVAATNDDTARAAAQARAASEAADDDTETDDLPDLQGRRPIRWAKLSDHVTESAYDQITKLGIRALCPPERRFARVYPHGQLAAQILGFTNHAGRGVAGIEAYADFYLRGQDGWREGEKDGRRHELAQFQTHNIPRKDGYSVVLSIDTTVQDIIEQQLDKIAKKYQPLKATIIVSDPRTGFILGMANYPTYDPNHYNLVPRDQMRRLKNIAVTDVYEPGSVFKIVASSGALNDGLVNEDTTFNCALDRIQYRGHDLRMPHDDHPNGVLSVAQILAKSSNRGAGQLAMLLGPARFEEYARAFGFGSILGFPVGPESPGILRPHDKWYPIDITRIAMGQSIAATPLQMQMAMSTIANGGVLMRPQVIRQIRDTNNNIVYQYNPVEIRRVISDETARRMARLLVGVVSPGGTAADAAIKIDGVDYEVAGKTGTAQKYMPEVQANGRVKLMPSRNHHVASFVGFFPASRPQVAISVIVDDADAHCPGGIAWGATVAVPVFKTIGEQLIPIIPINPPNQPVSLNSVAATQGGRR